MYAMRTILKKPPRTPSAPLREKLNWTTLHQRLHQRRHNFMLYQVHRCVTTQTTPYPTEKFKKNSTFYSHTRGAEKLHLSRPSSEYYRQSSAFQVVSFPDPTTHTRGKGLGHWRQFLVLQAQQSCDYLHRVSIGARAVT